MRFHFMIHVLLMIMNKYSYQMVKNVSFIYEPIFISVREGSESLTESGLTIC